MTSPDVLNSTSTSLLDVKKTAALITAQANGPIIDGNNPSTWTTTPSQPVMFLPS
jgi:hypothetical protein